MSAHRARKRIPGGRFACGAGLALLLALLPLVCGCARYAPEEPVAPKRVVLEITLITEEPVSTQFQYYIAMNIAQSTAAEGPSEQLSGTDRVKNWNYYIVYDGPSLRFREHFINTSTDIDIIPDIFDESSPRFYQATVSGNQIHLILYLDTLAPVANSRIWMNFVTSRHAIYDPSQDDIDSIDYLYPPYFYFTNSTVPQQISDNNYAQISSYEPTGEGSAPANITNWYISIYER